MSRLVITQLFLLSIVSEFVNNVATFVQSRYHVDIRLCHAFRLFRGIEGKNERESAHDPAEYHSPRFPRSPSPVEIVLDVWSKCVLVEVEQAYLRIVYAIERVPVGIFRQFFPRFLINLDQGSIVYLVVSHDGCGLVEYEFLRENPHAKQQ